MQRLLEHKIFTIFIIGYTVFLTIGSLINTGEVITTPNNFDKVIHFLAYFGLALFWMMWNVFRKTASKRTKELSKLTLVAVTIIIYGIFIEMLQGVFTTYRIADGWDILANTIGVVVALLLVLLLINKTTLLKTKI